VVLTVIYCNICTVTYSRSCNARKTKTRPTADAKDFRKSAFQGWIGLADGRARLDCGGRVAVNGKTIRNPDHWVDPNGTASRSMARPFGPRLRPIYYFINRRDT